MVVMTVAGSVDDPLAGWDSRRRAALEQLWRMFAAAGGESVSLSEELISERRAEAEDHPASLS